MFLLHSRCIQTATDCTLCFRRRSSSASFGRSVRLELQITNYIFSRTAYYSSLRTCARGVRPSGGSCIDASTIRRRREAPPPRPPRPRPSAPPGAGQADADQQISATLGRGNQLISNLCPGRRRARSVNEHFGTSFLCLVGDFWDYYSDFYGLRFFRNSSAFVLKICCIYLFLFCFCAVPDAIRL